MRSPAALALSALVAALLMAGCDGPTRSTVGKAQEAEDRSCEAEEGSKVASAPVTGADIYLDDSETMQGFISDAEHPLPVTPLQQLLRSVLVERLGDAGLSAGFYTFGLEVDPGPLPLSRLRDYVVSRSAYGKGENDIAAALEKAAERPRSLSLVITDNTQDLLTVKEGRALGFDRSGIVRAVSDRLAAKGFGVWLLGFQSAFDGSYYSVKLTNEPSGVQTNRSFRLQGQRPVYCWLISRDWDKGRKLALDLLDELRRLTGAGEAGEAVHGLELYPGIIPSLALEEPIERELARLEVKATAGRVREAELFDAFRVKSWTSYPGSPRVSSAELTFEQPRTPSIYFLLKGHLAQDTEEESLPLALPLGAWTVTPSPALALGSTVSSDVRHFHVEGASLPGPREIFTYWELAVPYNRLASTDHKQWNVKTSFSIAASLQPASESHWLRAWSSLDDTSAEAISGRTIYLYDIASRIVERTVGRERKHGCLALRFSREG